MKKISLFIVFLVCVLTNAFAGPIHVSSAMNYSSTYRGAGRNGYVYTTTRMHGSSTSMGMAQAPTASMGTTSAYGSTIESYGSTFTSRREGSVRGIRTSAEYIRGGVTAGATYGWVSNPRRSPEHPDWPPGIPECGCDWHDSGDGIWTCPICGCEWNKYDDGGDHCHCVEESGYCWCPIGDGWQVMLFLGIMAAVYAMYKKHNAHCEELS